MPTDSHQVDVLELKARFVQAVERLEVPRDEWDSKLAPLIDILCDTWVLAGRDLGEFFPVE
jgi:hypothetical protein